MSHTFSQRLISHFLRATVFLTAFLATFLVTFLGAAFLATFLPIFLEPVTFLVTFLGAAAPGAVLRAIEGLFISDQIFDVFEIMNSPARFLYSLITVSLVEILLSTCRHSLYTLLLLLVLASYSQSEITHCIILSLILLVTILVQYDCSCAED